MLLEVLLDADALLAVRKLSLLEAMIAAGSSNVCMRMTEYAARHELNSIGREVQDLVSKGCLFVDGVKRRSDADRLYRKLVHDGVDKGEAEAVAWAVHFKHAELVFVSVDRRARDAAEAHRILAADIMDLCVLLIDRAEVSADLLRQKLSLWLDREQQVGRPSDLVPFDFDEAYQKRYGRWNAAPLVPIIAPRQLAHHADKAAAANSLTTTGDEATEPRPRTAKTVPSRRSSGGRSN